MSSYFLDSAEVQFERFQKIVSQKSIGSGISHVLKFMFSKKASKIDKIFTVDLTLCSKGQIDEEDFVNFCGLLRKSDCYNQT